MIRVRLTGGLGNQMFQYAYGRSQSIKFGKPLVYYFVHYRGDTKRQFELGIFNIKGKKINGLLSDALLTVCNLLGIDFPYFACGYWQSPKYFLGYEKEIRKDFQFINPMDKKNLGVLNQIKKTNSVSIHIRRRDYVTNNITNQFHGICSIDYYEKAIGYMNKKIKSPKYFVFSDDPSWAKENLKLDNAVYIDWNTGNSSYKDMHLMSNCKHNIIANSSFSWWGAWLNPNPDKIVVSPKKWFKDKNAQKKAKDIIPTEWLKI